VLESDGVHIVESILKLFNPNWNETLQSGCSPENDERFYKT
jgi:hypothetical protein